MFDRNVYRARRDGLRRLLSRGVALFLGNEESPMNYADNTYPFRQDSSFLYYFGLDTAGLAAVLDLDEGTETLYGPEPTVEDAVDVRTLPRGRGQAFVRPSSPPRSSRSFRAGTIVTKIPAKKCVMA